MQPDTLRYKVLEPVLLLGKQRFANVDIRIRVKGGGHVSQIYAIRQAIAKALVAFYQKCEWEAAAGKRDEGKETVAVCQGEQGGVVYARLEWEESRQGPLQTWPPETCAHK